MKTTEQLARECGVRITQELYHGSNIEDLEAFGKAYLRNYFESAEPVAFVNAEKGRIDLCGKPGAMLMHGTKLYAAPKEE